MSTSMQDIHCNKQYEDEFKCKIIYENKNFAEEKMSEIRKSRKLKIVKGLWMASVNVYDLGSLLNLTPCGTLHATIPYISYTMLCY